MNHNNIHIKISCFVALICSSLLLVTPAVSDTNPTDGLVNYESPHVHPIDLTPDNNTLLAVNTAAHRLEIYNVANGGMTYQGFVPVGLDPVSVRARSNTEAWVVNHLSDSVSVVNLNTQTVTQTLQTDNEPADVVFAGTTPRAFVSASEANKINVFALNNLNATPTRINIAGEDPRALAVSPDGNTVYAAIFESGNGTTALSGGESVAAGNAVSRPESPYAGQNPPPNNGNSFSPSINPAIGTPPQTALIVRKDSQNRWKDDNNGDWTSFISGPLASLSRRQTGWDLPDNDVAIINANSLNVSYQKRLMNMVMALAVNPTSGRITAVGTEARNEVRFEPNLNGNFIQVNKATFTPGGNVSITDLNTHLDYSQATVSNSLREQSLGDPRGIAWNSGGSLALVTGMGSNNVIALSGSGNRIGRIEVGEGPTGVVFDNAQNRAFVMNKFAGSISVINTSNLTQTSTTAFNDPTPQVIKQGRKFLYDTHLTSGTGHTSCASCHVDARTDRLSWDLGNPAGALDQVAGADNNTGAATGSNLTISPMKGPMLTQTLQDIMLHPKLHWRGDRGNLADFNQTFTNLMGRPSQLSGVDMAEMGDFLNTIHLPPNPYRNQFNGRPASITLPDGSTATTSTFNALRGSNSRNNNCLRCHLGGGTRNAQSNSELGQAFIAPALSGFYDRLGYWPNLTTGSTSGFGFFHDGADTLGGAARTTNAERQTDMLAEILTLEGPGGPLVGGERRQDTHAGVGKQLTINGTASTQQTNQLNEMINIASSSPHAALIAKGNIDGRQRGYFSNGSTFQSDRQAEQVTSTQLLSLASAGQPITFTVVSEGTERRIGADANGNGILDGDENVTPLVANEDSVTTPANTAITIDVMANDSGDGIAITAVDNPANGTAVISNNRIIYTPNNGFSGTEIFWYSITDSRGAAYGTKINVTITAQNNGAYPTSAEDFATTSQNTAITIDVLANDSGNGLTLTSANPYSVNGGNVAITNGQILYTPKNNFTGVDNFWYVFSDNQGRSNFGKATITVNAANTAFPIANTDNYQTPQNTPQTLNILANDTGSGLSIDTLYDYTALGGTTRREANGDVLYTPKAGFTGEDNFWYVIIDSQGRKNSAQVKINVTASADFFPIANPDNYTVPRNATRTLNILNNDSTSDGGIAIDTLYDYSSQGGTTSRVGNEVRYTPKTDFTGQDDFWYVMIDAQGRKNSAQVIINVTP
ncbi:MAG: Ig-like domain-containing protein [Leucothrix sp.]